MFSHIFGKQWSFNKNEARVWIHMQDFDLLYLTPTRRLKCRDLPVDLLHVQMFKKHAFIHQQAE